MPRCRRRAATPATMGPTRAKAPRARSARRPIRAMSRPTAATARPATPRRCPAATPAGAGRPIPHAATDTNCATCHNGTTATGLKTPPHLPTDRRCSVELPHQHGVELHHLHDEPRRGGGGALRHLPQWVLHRPRAPRARWLGLLPGHVATNGRDCATCHTKAVSGVLVERRRGDYPCGGRHQLRELPQRYDRDRSEDAAACAGRPRVQCSQLPQQHGDELHHLYDEPCGGGGGALRQLPQRVLHGEGNQGRAGLGLPIDGHWTTRAARYLHVPATPRRRPAAL